MVIWQIASVLLGVQTSENLLLAVLLHAATCLSTIIVFRKEIFEVLDGLFKFQWNDQLQFSLKILISVIPVGVVGILYEDQIAFFFLRKFIACWISFTFHKYVAFFEL